MINKQQFLKLFKDKWPSCVSRWEGAFRPRGVEGYTGSLDPFVLKDMEFIFFAKDGNDEGEPWVVMARLHDQRWICITATESATWSGHNGLDYRQGYITLVAASEEQLTRWFHQEYPQLQVRAEQPDVQNGNSEGITFELAKPDITFELAKVLNQDEVSQLVVQMRHETLRTELQKVYALVEQSEDCGNPTGRCKHIVLKMTDAKKWVQAGPQRTFHPLLALVISNTYVLLIRVKDIARASKILEAVAVE